MCGHDQRHGFGRDNRFSHLSFFEAHRRKTSLRANEAYGYANMHGNEGNGAMTDFLSLC